MTHTSFELPYKQEFLLGLTNNNYSAETVFNYERDLEYFEAYLWQSQKEFKALDKLDISKFKGFLANPNHIKTVHDYNHWRMEQKQAAIDQEMGLKNQDLKPESAKKTMAQSVATESSYKAPKMNFGDLDGLTARSINRMLSTLRGFLKFLVEIDQSIPISADAVKLLKTERKESQVGELNDLVSLIEAPEKYETNPAVRTRNRAILELIFSTGMRISEVVRLNRDQLTFYKEDKYDGNIAGKMYIKGKGKKSRFVYLTERCKHWLEEYLQGRRDDYPALFIPYRGGRAGTKDPQLVRISTNYIQERIVTYRRKLGIVVPTSAHSLRHGFATYLAEEGASPAAIQRLLGHESLQTTTRYVHTSDKFAETTHRQFHPLQED